MTKFTAYEVNRTDTESGNALDFSNITGAPK